METTLKFKEEDRAELELALNGGNLMGVILELDNWLRAEEKYKERSSIKIEEVRDQIRALLSDNGLTFDSIIFT